MIILTLNTLAMTPLGIYLLTACDQILPWNQYVYGYIPIKRCKERHVIYFEINTVNIPIN